MKVQRDPSEIEGLVREQMDFLTTSADLFDQGRRAEAKRLAVTLRVLLHHRPPTSHALLEQAGMLQVMPFLDSCGEISETNQLTSHSLTLVRSEVGADGRMLVTYEPLRQVTLPRRLDVREQIRRRVAGEHIPRHPGEHMPFTHWWSQTVIKDNTGARFNRGDLVKAMANQDGGAHVDPELRDAYHSLCRNNSLGWIVNDHVEGERPMENPVPASVRQIVWEVIETVRAEAPELLP